MTKKLITAAMILSVAAWGQEQSGGARPGDAQRGERLFDQQHCIICHSINGTGGKSAPDLGRRSASEMSPSILAGAMWNHGPAMWKAMAAQNLPVPSLEPGDVADLFAYFYSLRYFGPPGDAARGKQVFLSNCAACHAGSGIGPPISTWPSNNPIEWAQQMWNHIDRMSREAEQRHIRWPQLTSQQMVDLMTYMQHLPGSVNRAPAMRFNDPAAGQKLFDSKNCSKCHTLGAAEPGEIDLLRRVERFHTLVDFATAMWDHGPQMRKRSAAANITFPAFEENEMSDLLAYLFDKHYFDERGDAGRGARVYRARQCGTCHDKGEAGAPSLAQFRGRISPLFMSSALWRHGPRMLQETEKRGIRWPTFTGSDMADLIAYLNR